jgi:hypothetical protein
VASAQLNQSLVGADGAPTDTARALERLDAAFVVCFAAELAVNAYAHWLRPFLRSGWVQIPPTHTHPSRPNLIFVFCFFCFLLE